MSIQTSPQFVAELTVYDRSIATTRVLRYAVKGLVTKPAETPANTFFDERVTQPIDIQRTMFASRATRGRSTTAYGQLVLSNLDGALDGLNEYHFDGRAITVRRTTTYNPSYPSDYTTILVGTMAGQPEFSLSEIRVTVRDRLYEVTSTPLQSNRYAGSNVLPAGLEGVPEDLGGKVKPVCLGTVKNVPAPCVNTSKLIYQVNDGAVNSVDVVYDRGVALAQGHAWSSAGTVGAGSANTLFYGGGLWVYAGFSAGTIYTSTDRQAWTLKYTVSGTIPSVIDATYHAGEWLLSASHGAGSLLLHTTDSFTTVTTSAAPAAAFNSVFYHAGASLWIGMIGGVVYSSPDGSAWTLRYTATGAGSSYLDGEYLNGVGVIIGIDNATNQGLAISSTDGVNWFVRESGITTSGSSCLTRVAVGSDRIVAVGASDAAMTLDGITWTRAPLPQAASNLAQVAFADDLFVTLPSSGSGLLVSVDGLDWALMTDGLTGVTLNSLASDGVNLVGGNSSSVVRYTSLATYAASSDLLDDAQEPLPGQYKSYVAGGYFRLGSTPDGVITSDVTQGAASANRTTAQLANLVLARLTSAPSFAAGDVTALDLAASAVNGYWSIEDGVTCANVLDFLVGTPGASWFVGNDGSFHLKQLTAPSGTPDLTVVADDLTKLERVISSDDSGGVPPWKIQVRWGKYYQTITSDIAGAVTDEDRAQFAQEWRDVTSSDSTILTEHPSSQVMVIESAFSAASDAQTESDRQLALRGTKRDLYDLTMALNDQTALIDINNVIEVIHPRFSLSVVGSPSGALSGGGLFRVLDVRPDAKNARVTFTVWGRSRYQNVVDANGAYVLDHNGAYVLSWRAA